MGAHNSFRNLELLDNQSASGTDLDLSNLDVSVKTLTASGAVIGGGGAGAALTAALTTLTHTAPGTPDFAIQTLTSTTPFGFVTADEGQTVLQVLVRTALRVAEIEARLEAAGIVTAN